MDGQRVAPPPMQKPSSLGEQFTPGQQLEGTVTKITEFGAFVDIGAGRDGMVHISELQPGRVQKVSDIVSEGQQVSVWVKSVDAKKNRISLTMVDPNRRTIRDLMPGAVVKGRVTRLAPYGAFVDIGVEREGMLHVKEMGDGYVQDPSAIVKMGETIEVRIVAVDAQRRRIDLSMKAESLLPSSPAPEPVAPLAAPEEEDAPTYMEMAIKRALERRERRDRKEKKRREQDEFRDYRDEQEDILTRTLERHRHDR